MVCGMSVHNLKAGLLNVQLWFSQSHPIHHQNPSFENPGISPSLMKGLGRKLADTCLPMSNHQQWRIPPLSHVINSQLLHILSNLLSSPSPVITSLRDGIIQERKR